MPFKSVRSTIATVFLVVVSAAFRNSLADDFVQNRCELIPLPQQQVSFQIDGVEKLRWQFRSSDHRPYFYPLNGPSGVSLTRMGHPGAQNHDHHRSVWFAHHKVNGIDFWSDTSKARIRQKHWYSYRDGQNEAVMASLLGWFDDLGKEVMEQELVAALRPLSADACCLELQLTFRPAQGTSSVVLNRTNFGLLAVRVSKTLSEFFGGGQLTSSEGGHGEKDIFGKQARWIDYSGPVVVGTGRGRHLVREGLTYFDHPDNPRYPAHWHVRADGWMGASFGMYDDWTIEAQNPLVLRYLLHAHSGDYDAESSSQLHQAFANRAGFVVRPSKAGEQHRQFLVERAVNQPPQAP